MTWIGLMVNGPILNGSPGSNLVQFGVIQQAVFFELAFHVGQRELGAADRNVQLGQNPGQRADVVFVAVRQHDRPHVLAILVR